MIHSREQLYDPQDVTALVECFGGLDDDTWQARMKYHAHIQSALELKKGERDDVGAYNAQCLMRQRVINERVVEWSGVVVPGAKILDGCAGPEGSYLAAVRRGADWTGVEIANETAAYLAATGAKVVISSAGKLPLKDQSFDGIFYVYAINNVLSTFDVITEAERVLRKHGSIVVADPGLTIWISDLVLYSLMLHPRCPAEIKKCLSGQEKFKNNIPRYYREVSAVTHEEYSSKILEGLIGTDMDHLLAGLDHLAYFIKKYYGEGRKGHRLRRVFSGIMYAKFWSHLMECARRIGLNLSQMGIMSASRKKDSDDWHVTNVFDLGVTTKTTSTDVASTLYTVKNGRHPLSPSLIQTDLGAHQTIITPLMKFRKD